MQPKEQSPSKPVQATWKSLRSRDQPKQTRNVHTRLKSAGRKKSENLAPGRAGRALFRRDLGTSREGPSIHIGCPEPPLWRARRPQDVVAGARNPAYAAAGCAVRRGSAQDSKADTENRLPALHNVHYQAMDKAGEEMHMHGESGPENGSQGLRGAKYRIHDCGLR